MKKSLADRKFSEIAEENEFGQLFAECAEKPKSIRIPRRACKIEVKHIAEIAVSFGPRFELSQIQSAHSEARKIAVQRARCVRQAENQADFVGVFVDFRLFESRRKRVKLRFLSCIPRSKICIPNLFAASSEQIAAISVRELCETSRAATAVLEVGIGGKAVSLNVFAALRQSLRM